MFTGIIEEIGVIRQIKRGVVSGSMAIGAETILTDVRVGDSIAVNGICLTVTGLGDGCFTVDVMHETVRRSGAGGFTAGDRVNLERALAANGRLGGHIVSGHIDGVGRVKQIQQDENAVWYEITADAGVLRYIVEKGSVAVDGISLTVADVGKSSFRVSVIPHTRNQTTLSEKKKGDTVNLETDCIGKYVEKLLQKRSDRQEEGMTTAFLLEHGFL